MLLDLRSLGKLPKSKQVIGGLIEQRRDLQQRLSQPLERLAEELARPLAALGIESARESA
jgi:hypothetical protein